MTTKRKNILGTALQACCHDPLTGFFRDGHCHTSEEDYGDHVLCAVMTEEFLAYTREKGNDLTTQKPAWGFPGLKTGDKWCLCASRWMEAQRAGRAPALILEACDARALEHAPLELYKEYEFQNKS